MFYIAKPKSGSRLGGAIRKAFISCLCFVTCFMPQDIKAWQQPVSVTYQIDSTQHILREEEGTHFTKTIDSTVKVVVNYRLNSSLLMKDYKGNSPALDTLNSILDASNSEFPDYIYITASASPEGSTSENRRLAAARSQALKGYIVWRYPHFDQTKIILSSMDEDWEGLYAMVLADAGVPYKKQVLDILNSDAESNAKRIRIQAVGGGAAYSYISKYILPVLRMACAVYAVYKTELIPLPSEEPEPVIVPEPEPEPVVDSVVVTPEKPIVAPEPEKKLLPFAIKTNLLFDAATALNAEVEIPIGECWSVAGEYTFPWWLNEDKQNAFQFIMGIVEPRYWLGNRDSRRQLTGWFVGIHGGGGYYDLERKDKGWQGEFFVAGLSGGYAHTLGKSGRWRMEYSLGLGYMGSKYREYEPRIGVDGEWHLIRRHNAKISWIGPTRAKVSLVFMFGNGKGGAR